MKASTYHNLTSYNRHAMTPHRLDWGHVPLLQKAYPLLSSTSLPPPGTLPDGSLTDVFFGKSAGALLPTLGFNHLSAILRLANGITAKRRYGSQTQFYRSAPSAGALYPNETYVAAGTVEGLVPGLYNYQVMDDSLAVLRQGNQILQGVGSALTSGSGKIPAASLLITGIFFRSAWKYRVRAFRYVLLDAGHLIENLVLAASAYGVAYSVHYDFDDDAAGHLLGIDGKREACLAIINLYTGGGESPKAPAEHQIDLQTLSKDLADASRTSSAEIHYEAIQQVYTAGKTFQPGKTRDKHPYPVVRDTPQTWIPIHEAGEGADKQNFVQNVLQRRSRRNFVPAPLPTSHALQLMRSLCPSHTHAGDEGRTYGGCMTPGFVAVNIEAFDPGIYLMDTQEKAYSLVSGQASKEKVARVCLDQEWLKNGSLHFLFMANLSLIDLHLGARGYRYAMLNAGRAGQRIYLTATALGCGACGIGALYDDETRQMLSLNDDSALLYLVGVGVTKSEF